MNVKQFVVPPGTHVRLKDHDPDDTGKFKSRKSCEKVLNRELEELRPLQALLYAQKQYGCLIIVDGTDASGKDGVVNRVMSGSNPNWCSVANFKVPSSEELAHDFMWRCAKEFPERGKTKMFNRSYYEEARIVRIRPELLAKQHLPPETMGPNIWKHRFASINAFELHLVQNGFPVIKIFLHISKEEQRKRLLARIENREKNWKFSLDDVYRRQDWKMNIRAQEAIFRHTSTEYAPWYNVPANHKWFARAVSASIIVHRLKQLNIDYPAKDRRNLLEGKILLESE